MLLRVLPLLIPLALCLAPASQAAVFVAAVPPASSPPSTPENACTAFLPNESESRIGLLVSNDPLDRTDPMGLDTEVQLQYYIIGKAPIQGEFGHQYVHLRDTSTGETVISRAGPSEQYRQGSLAAHAISNSTEKTTTGKGNITIQTSMKAAADSVDAGHNAKTVPGSTTTLKEAIGAAKGTLQKFNNAVDSAKIDYKPQSTNSNAYAGTAYDVLTGKPPPTMNALPGSKVDLKPQIPEYIELPKARGN